MFTKKVCDREGKGTRKVRINKGDGNE